MNKREFVRALMEENNILRDDANTVVDMVFKQIRKQLLSGREVRIEGVGRFSLKYREAGVVNNNLQGRRHHVPARVKLKFYPFDSFERSLNAFLASEVSSAD